MVEQFHFNVTLTVLNSLGRDLYRTFSTILGEAISNSWDADAKNVHIYINREENYLIIKDDGVGMNADDFQNKFLKIGYSKRTGGKAFSDAERPFIGRKGIGKLALLSCSQKIHVLTKKGDTEYTGATIDNTQIDEDIAQNISTEEHYLENVDPAKFGDYINNHPQGTILMFENLNDGINNTVEFFRRVIALYYRFSLIDNDFNIYVNDEQVTESELDDLVEDTQILWMLNDLNEDPFVKNILDKTDLKVGKDLLSDLPIRGFIATVEKPSQKKTRGVDENLTIDLFVNGRLREKDILRHISSNRLYESYVYGQIHFDSLDDENDRFTSSREGVKSNDEQFEKLKTELQKKILPKVIAGWDDIRVDLRQDGDPESERNGTPVEKKARSLVNVLSSDYTKKKKKETADHKANPETKRSIEAENERIDKIEEWVSSLSADAIFNVASYTECFISENLIRKYINEKAVTLSEEALEHSKKYKGKEIDARRELGMSISIRKNQADEHYLDMDNLANLIDKPTRDGNREYELSLSKKAKEYKPVRNATMHTALLTDEAKLKLTTVYNEIKARLINLFYST